MDIIFDLPHLYYLPQYLPVYEVLLRRGVRPQFVVSSHDDQIPQVLAGLALPYTLKAEPQLLDFYRSAEPDWIVFGNGYPDLAGLAKGTRTALLYHGIGVKACYYDSDLAEMDVRFVEGPARASALRRLFPASEFCEVGFAKLDPLLGAPTQRSRFDLAGAGLDPERPTVLYAPTFFPSSIERLPLDWPRHCSEWNLLIKPHAFSLGKKRYRNQRRRFQAWDRWDHVYVAGPEHYSLLPFFGVSDLLISEASSALFEFAALDRPVVWCDFLHLRWSYRGPFQYRLNRRMDSTMEAWSDVGLHAARPEDLASIVSQQLNRPEECKDSRSRCTSDLIGNTDGLAAERIADRLLV